MAVARKAPGVKPPFRSALGSAKHARAREADDYETPFAPLEPIPYKEIESLSVGTAEFVSLPLLIQSFSFIHFPQPDFSCANCVFARVECQPFGYGVQCARCQTKRSKTCDHTLSSMELSNVYAALARQNSVSVESKPVTQSHLLIH